MGSGKTTVGRFLAARLGWTFVDLDDRIAERCGLSVPEIFAQFGEPHFRREEAGALLASLGASQLVLALGGGAPEAETNRNLLRQSPRTAVVYLQGSFETLQERCAVQSLQTGQDAAVARPVFADLTLARQRFSLRAPLYAEIATLTVDTDGRPPETLAAELAIALRLPTPEPSGR